MLSGGFFCLFNIIFKVLLGRTLTKKTGDWKLNSRLKSSVTSACHLAD